MLAKKRGPDGPLFSRLHSFERVEEVLLDAVRQAGVACLAESFYFLLQLRPLIVCLHQVSGEMSDDIVERSAQGTLTHTAVAVIGEPTLVGFQALHPKDACTFTSVMLPAPN